MPDVLKWLPMDSRRRCAVVRFPPEVDAAAAPRLREHMLILLNRGAGGIIADLSGTRFCDSTGLSVLLRARTRANAMGTPIGLVLPDDGPVRKVFDVSGVGELFPRAATPQHVLGELAPVAAGGRS